MKKFLSLALVFTLILGSLAVTPAAPAQAATKKIVIAHLSSNRLSCHKATFNIYLNKNVDWEWQNIVGYGKKMSYKVSPNCKFYSLNAADMKLHKVSRSTFKKNLSTYGKHREHGVIWYWGTAAKITIKGGKVVKIQQLYQS